ncbi:MAG: class I SAM-dependent methyltransferase [Chloroflexota bacterium]
MESQIRHYYDQNVTEEWQRLIRHRTEFGVTMLALSELLPPPPATVIDIGGGPGRYAIALTEQGYEVTLVDLSNKNLEMAREQAEQSDVSVAGYHQANVLDLSMFPSSSFDAVVMLGPLYHLLSEDERLRAVEAGKRLLKNDGLLFAAFINRFAQIRYAAKYEPEWLVDESEYTEAFLASGVHQILNKFTYSYFAHPEEVVPFMEQSGLETVKMIGCEGVVARIEEKINALEGEAWRYWVALNYRLGHEPSLYGASDHLLYIGRKVD